MANKSEHLLHRESDSGFLKYLRRALPVRLGGSPGGSLPDMTGHAGEVLSTDGNVAFWDVSAPNYPTVANFSTLPDPTTVPQEIYVVLASQGTKWLPGFLGGTYYAKGFYYSDGAAWSYLGEIPYQASQLDVNQGIITDQFVSPATLDGWKDQVLLDCGGV